MGRNGKRTSQGNIKSKLAVIMLMIIAAFILMAARLIYWSAVKGHEFEKSVLKQQRYYSKDIPYERGKIYDATGKVLAANQKVYTLVLEPKHILLTEDEKKEEVKSQAELDKAIAEGEKDPGTKLEENHEDATLRALETYMGIPKEKLRKDLEERKDSLYYEYDFGRDLTFDDVAAMKKFMRLATEKKSEAKDQKRRDKIIQSEKITGVYFIEEFKRIYPYDSLASHVMGFTSYDQKGQTGLEQYYNKEMSGTDGRDFAYLDEEMQLEKVRKEAENGDSIVSTIRVDVQKAIEKQREKFDKEVGSKMTTITVMNPNNGEIYGMTSSGEYDLNRPNDMELLKTKYSDQEISVFEENQEKENDGIGIKRKPGEILTISDAFSSIWKNSVVSDTYEPGSTFKPFTVASVLEENIYQGDETFSCPGYLMVGKNRIGCSHKHGEIEFKDVIAQSCNTALMTMGLQEGKEIFTGYQKEFGFGQKTGIDLPGEANTSGLLYPADRMQDVDLATNSFGQNFNVTGIQMISAFSSLINGGYYYKPHVVKQIIGEDGSVVKNIDKVSMRTTVSKETSETLRKMLEETVLSGTGKKAAIKGATVGGKTGTAEKISPVERNGKTYYVRNKTDYLVSFMGFTPTDKPEVVIYVTIDEPHVDFQANAGLAVDLERECMEDIIKILDLK